MYWIVPGIICLVLVWIYLRVLLMVILAVALIGWIISRIVVYMPEGTAMKINGLLGQRILFCWQNHGLDSDNNIVSLPKANYPAFHWLGLAGLLGSREVSRVMYLSKGGVLRDRKTPFIPLDGRWMEVLVQAVTLDAKKAEVRFALKVRVCSLRGLGDWAQRVRNEIWARAGQTVSQRELKDFSGSRTTICAAIKRSVNSKLAGQIEVIDMSITSVAEGR
jgi:hypothetical protein